MGKLLECLHSGAYSRLFVHCGASVNYLAELRASHPGLEKDAERALLLAERQDIVCLTNEVEPAYLDFLADLGLGPDAQNLIIASRFQPGDGPLWERLLESEAALEVLSDRMRAEGTTHIHPFIASAGEFELASALRDRTGLPVRVAGGDPELVAYADCKHHIRAKAVELGIPVAPGEVVDLGETERGRSSDYQSLRHALERQVRRTGRIIVRGTAGAAGSATFLANGSSDELDLLADRLSRRTDNRIYLVEAMVDAVASPNVQIHIDLRGSPQCVGVSDQLLDGGLTHRGNAHPSDARCIEDMITWACIIGEWLGDTGYVGIAGFDFIEYLASNGTPKAFLAELNPRINGATYPLAVRERIAPRSAFVSGMVATQAGSFAELSERLSHLLYSRQRRSGVIPFATGCLDYGKCGIIALAPTRREAAELLAETAFASEPVRALARTP
jgi:Pre ATP-grasp domain